MTEGSDDTHTDPPGPRILVVDVAPPFAATPASRLLRGPAAAMSRVRPGDRPQWFAVGASPGRAAGLRALAADLRLGVDVVAALAIEWRLLDENLGAARLLALCDDVLATGRTVTPIAPSAGLRAWSEQTPHRRGAASTHGDELPELAVPARPLARWRPTTAALERALDLLDVDRARRVDSAAAARGFTMTELVYRHGSLRKRADPRRNRDATGARADDRPGVAARRHGVGAGERAAARGQDRGERAGAVRARPRLARAERRPRAQRPLLGEQPIAPDRSSGGRERCGPDAGEQQRGDATAQQDGPR